MANTTQTATQRADKMMKTYMGLRNLGWSHSAASHAVITGRRNKEAVQQFLARVEAHK